MWQNVLLLVVGRDVRTKTWPFPFPSIPSARDGAAVIVHNDQSEVVVGGYRDDVAGEVPAVEILLRHLL